MSQAKQIKKALTAHKPVIQRQFGVKTIGIFGSYIRGEEKRGSDLDVLVEFKKPIGLFEFMDLERYLAKALELKIDLVSRKALKPAIGAHILKEVEYV